MGQIVPECDNLETGGSKLNMQGMRNILKMFIPYFSDFCEFQYACASTTLQNARINFTKNNLERSQKLDDTAENEPSQISKI
jgi:hypothetical protein